MKYQSQTMTVALALLLSVSILAQNAPSAEPTDKKAGAQSSPDYSGMYAFLREGEFLQLTIEDDGVLTGFVSRYKDEADEGSNQTFVDHFFKQGKLDGKKLAFTTEFAQNISYEFTGTIERGEGKSTQDEAYYVLKGTLTQHVVEQDKRTTSTSKTVAFRSFPQDVGADAPK